MKREGTWRDERFEYRGEVPDGYTVYMGKLIPKPVPPDDPPGGLPFMMLQAHGINPYEEEREPVPLWQRWVWLWLFLDLVAVGSALLHLVMTRAI